MEAEAIDRLIYLVREGQRQRIIEAPDFAHTGRYHVHVENGEPIEFFAEPEMRSGSVTDADSLAKLIGNDLVDAAGHAEVFASKERIVALLHGPTQRWRHELPLPRHPAFARLQQLARTQEFDQRRLVRLLRAEFNGHVDDAIIERFRHLKLSSEGSGKQVVEQGRAAVDKSIQKRVQDERGQAIPDEIGVTVPVFDVDGARDELVEVMVLVDCVPDDNGHAVFELTSVVNDLREAERHVLDLVIGQLRDGLREDVPVYLGSA